MRIGIDPGLHGAIALLKDNGELVSVLDMPIMASTGDRQQVNAAELAKMLWPCRKEPMNGLVTAYVERVAAMPGQGVSSMFNFGVSYGVVLGVLAALGIPVILMSPGKWKRAAGLIGKPKDFSRTVAQQLYPDASLGRKRDCGRADAILIALYADLCPARGNAPHRSQAGG